MYGYHYAAMLTIFGICIFFSNTVPLVSLASAFYVGLKHLVDGLNLITVHRKEIDSQGQLIDATTNSALVFVVLYQLSMIAFFVISEKPLEALICSLIFVISILFLVTTYPSVNSTNLFESEEDKFTID
jgi:hypothetical protein